MPMRIHAKLNDSKILPDSHTFATILLTLKFWGDTSEYIPRFTNSSDGPTELRPPAQPDADADKLAFGLFCLVGEGAPAPNESNEEADVVASCSLVKLLAEEVLTGC